VTASKYAAERQVALRAVREAARVCRSVRAAFAPDQAHIKDDRSPVTVADYASQALISLELGESFPDDEIVGEETSASIRADPDSPLSAAVVEHVRTQRGDVGLEEICRALERCGGSGGPVGRHWTVDPVDGTKGFLRNQQYAVALALVVDGRVALGVLAAPNLAVDPADPGSPLGCVFIAERGAGAWQLPLDGDEGARRIHVSDVTDPRCARYAESYESGHSLQDVTARIAEELGMPGPPMRIDSQTKYAVVARGQAEVYLRLPQASWVEQSWDHAAGSLIVEEAGGRVSDVEGRDLDFSTGRRLERNRGLVVAGASLHAAVLAAAARVTALER
jgi:3'(2'), 5'-bisphosphate nucleotidase